MATIPPRQEASHPKPVRETNSYANRLLDSLMTPSQMAECAKAIEELDRITSKRDPALSDAEWTRQVVDQEIARLRGQT